MKFKVGTKVEHTVIKAWGIGTIVEINLNVDCPIAVMRSGGVRKSWYKLDGTQPSAFNGAVLINPVTKLHQILF